MVHKMLRSQLLLGAATGLITAALFATSAHAADAADTGADSESGSRTRRDDIVVTAERGVQTINAATKSTLPIADTPQSISVITSSQIAGLGLQSLNQALRYVAGVTPETRGTSAEVYDQFKLRGFDVPTYLDGLKMFSSATGYAVPQVDVSRIDSIEIVKGAASALYGASSPGGFVNEQSKLPIDRDFYGAASAR